MTIETAYAEQDRGIELDGIEDLERFRTEVDRILVPGQALIVTFERRGCAVYLGLHGDFGFVHVTPVPDRPPYLITVGDRGRGGTVEFFLHGVQSPITSCQANSSTRSTGSRYEVQRLAA